MITIIDNKKMGKSEQGWLHSTFHFSFAQYYNPNNIQYGALRVINDDVFDAGNGFDTHPHKNMEIISYVIDGVLTHQDSMGNKRTLTRGQVQYMSAGTGVFHSEHNFSNEPARFLQIWIFPDKDGYTPQYGDFAFSWEDRQDKWLKIASGNKENSPVCIHQDAEVSVTYMEAGSSLTYALKPGRKAYVVQIEGDGAINDNALTKRDGAMISNEENLVFTAKSNSHYILFDLAE